MKKILIALSLASMSLSSCTTVRSLSGPAPLSRTTIDEKTLIVGLQTFDTVLTAIDRLVAARVIVPGTPRAIQIADAIQKAKVAYQAASAAQKVGNASSYLAALVQAQDAIVKINALVKG